ncbi:MAG: hypothetical protein Q8N88_03635, partial [Nanoarchaeota archaeon]|nr:hypothetical protein [Nanoarchaeota archaeon]
MKIIPFKKNRNTEENFTIPITYSGMDDTMFKGSNGKNRFCFRTTPINADLMNDNDIENVVDLFSRWINLLKGRCQISLISQIVDLTQNIKHHEKMILEADSDLDIEILSRSIKHFEELSTTTNKVMNYYFVIESPYENINTTQQYFDKLYSEFSLLLGEYVNTFIMTNKTHYDLVQSIVNPASKEKPYDVSINPDYIEITNEYFKTENKYYNFFYLSDYDTQISYYRALKEMFKYK